MIMQMIRARMKCLTTSKCSRSSHSSNQKWQRFMVLTAISKDALLTTPTTARSEQPRKVTIFDMISGI